MSIPHYATILSQAEALVEKKRNESSENKILYSQEGAASFFASGMYFRLREDTLNSGYIKDIFRDESGEMYLEFLEELKKPVDPKLLQAAKVNLTLFFKIVCDGYDYECKVIEREENKRNVDEVIMNNTKEKPDEMFTDDGWKYMMCQQISLHLSRMVLNDPDNSYAKAKLSENLCFMAQFDLGLPEKHHSDAFYYAKAAAEMGSREGAVILGKFYEQINQRQSDFHVLVTHDGRFNLTSTKSDLPLLPYDADYVQLDETYPQRAFFYYGTNKMRVHMASSRGLLFGEYGFRPFDLGAPLSFEKFIEKLETKYDIHLPVKKCTYLEIIRDLIVNRFKDQKE